MKQTNKKTPEGREKAADWLEALEPEEPAGGEFPGFSFYLTVPKFGAEEVSNKKHGPVNTIENMTQLQAIYKKVT